MRRGSSGVVAVAALVLGSVAPVASVAPAVASAHSATQGWRLVKIFTARCGGTLRAITATGRSGGWATGEWGCGHIKPLIARSDGRSWRSLQPPRQFTDATSGAAVAALSPSYAWTFVTSDVATVGLEPREFALLWQNGHWRSFLMPGAGQVGVSQAVAFTRSDAWAFGSITRSPATVPATTVSPTTVSPTTGPYAARFNGHAWRTMPIPVEPTGVAASGPRSIWAAGQLAPTTNQPAVPPLALAHWTGRWRTILFPKLSLSPGWLVNGMWVVPDKTGPDTAVPDKATGVWILTEIIYQPSGPNVDLLLHWTGSMWRHIKLPYKSHAAIGPMTSDGHGGLWIATYPLAGTLLTGLAMVHYSSAGVWTRTFMPFLGAQIMSMRLIPGTRSVWAAGTAAAWPTIFKYGR